MKKVIVKRLDLVSSFIAGDKTLLKEVLHPKNDRMDADISLAFASILPGESSVPHALKQTEIYICTSGSGQLFIYDDVYSLEVGTSILVPPNANQWVKNTGDTNLDFYCIVSPAWSENDETIL